MLQVRASSEVEVFVSLTEGQSFFEDLVPMASSEGQPCSETWVPVVPVEGKPSSVAEGAVVQVEEPLGVSTRTVSLVEQ